MEWFVGAYVVGIIITTGIALASDVKAAEGDNDREVNLFGCLACGIFWPVLWVAVVAYAVVK